MGEGNREHEELQQERIAGEEASEERGRNRLIVGYAIASTVVLAIAAGVFVLASGSGGGDGDAHINLNLTYGSTNGIQPDPRAGTPPAAAPARAELAVAAREAGCELRLNLRDEGHEHIAVDAATPRYGTNPPTSGPHVEPPYQQADGAYREMPREIDIVHSLEHGRLEIQYSPELPEPDQLELKGLYDTMYGAALLFPNDRMPYAVAATTWTNLLGCPRYEGQATLDAIRAFGKRTWGKFGGEPVAAFPFTGPTPAEQAEP